MKQKDAPDAGTDSLVQATIVRDGNDLRVLNLDYPTEDDLERGAIRDYNYIGPTNLCEASIRLSVAADDLSVGANDLSAG